MSYKSIILALVAIVTTIPFKQPNLGECPELTWEESYPESSDSDAENLYFQITMVDTYIVNHLVPPNDYKKEKIPCSLGNYPGCEAWNQYIK